MKGEKKARRDRPSAVAAVAGLVRPSSGGWWWLWRRVEVALCGRALVKNDAENVRRGRVPGEWLMVCARRDPSVPFG